MAETQVKKVLLDEDEYNKLIRIMVRIWLSTPKTQNKFSRSAYVPWRLIHELETVLNDHGYDTAIMRAAYERKQKEAR